MNGYLLIAGNVLSFVAQCFLLLSSLQKEKKKILLYQIIECSICLVALLCLGAYSGMAVTFLSIARNLLTNFNLNNKYTTTLIVILIWISGLLIGINEIYALLPLISGTMWTIAVGCKNISRNVFTICRITDLTLWSIYALFVKDYAGFTFKSAAIVFTIHIAIKTEKGIIKKMKITKKSIVGDVLDYDDTTAEYFIEIGMHCLGCPTARHETLEQACKAHGQDVNNLLQKLQVHIEKK